ncbi:hypothetical protein [Spirosoma daeguense]
MQHPAKALLTSFMLTILAVTFCLAILIAPASLIRNIILPQMVILA